jgi:hypothetical protein
VPIQDNINSLMFNSACVVEVSNIFNICVTI